MSFCSCSRQKREEGQRFVFLIGFHVLDIEQTKLDLLQHVSFPCENVTKVFQITTKLRKLIVGRDQMSVS